MRTSAGSPPRPASTRPAPASSAATTSTAPLTCAGRLFDRLSESQRAGQLFMVGIPTDAPPAAARQAAVRAGAGGVILYGGGGPPAAQVRQLVSAVQAESPGAALGIHLYVAADQEGGQVQELSGPGFSAIPSGVEQGQLPLATLRQAAAGWARAMAAAGVNLDLAPVADVVPASLGTANQPDGRYGRQLGSDPGLVAAHVAAVVQGLQSAGVGATLKHFPGLGRVIGNTDVVPDVVDTQTSVSDPYLAPFSAGMAAGARMVMVSLARYHRIAPGVPAAYSRTVITGLLRGRLGFGGVVISDDLGSAASASSVPADERAATFVRAGGDIALVVRPASVVAPMLDGLLQQESVDPELRAAVDAAARRVLENKQAGGLLTCS